MYQTSENFKNAVYGDSRTFLAKISDGANSASEEILSLKQTSRSVADDCISIGGAVSSYVEVKMRDRGFTLDGTELEISIGMTIDSEPEWVPLGIFTAQKPKSDNGVVTFTAYDRIQTRMSGAFISELTYPCDGKAVLAEMAKKTGVPIITTNLPDGVMVPKRAVSTDSIVDESGNPVTVTKYVTPFDGYTYREALSYIAQFYGMFATMDRVGNVVFRWYSAADCSISADRYYDDLTLGESVFTVEKIICQAGNDTLSAGEGTACMQLENPVMTQERLTAVHQQIKVLEFLPASVSFLGDPRIDVGDIITVTDKTGNVVKIPVMSLVQDYDGGLLSEVQSFGKVESESLQNKGPTDQKIDRLYKDLFLVKELVGEKASFGYVYSVSAKVRKLETETITADRIDVNGIFAKDITVTGTIMGAVLKGAWVQAKGSDGSKATLADGKINLYRTEVENNVEYMYEGQFDAYSTSMTALKKGELGYTTIGHTHINPGLIELKDSATYVAISISPEKSIFDCPVSIGADFSVSGVSTMPALNITDRIEITQSTPYIDFHWGNTDTDYTSRIIENNRNELDINGARFTLGGAIWGKSLSIDGGAYVTGAGSFGAGVACANESRFYVNSYTDPYPGKTCTIKSWGTIASLRFAAKGVSTSWLGGAKTGGAAYDTICLDDGALVPGWRIRSKDGAWVGASYALEPGFRIYYCKNDRLAGNNNATDAIYTFGSSGTFHAKSVSQTSDEREKNILSGITEKYENFFMQLKPILFNWKSGADGVHIGFGAQTTLNLAEQCGIGASELAAVHKSETEEPWSMSYTEIVPLTVQMTQKAIRRVEDVENTFFENEQIVIENKAKIEALQEKIRQLYVYISELQTIIQERG